MFLLDMTSLSTSFLVFLSVILGSSGHVHNFRDQLYEGDDCTIAGTDVTGICTPITNCAVVEEALRNERKTPQICSFVRDLSIVCCPIPLPIRPISPIFPFKSRIRDEGLSHEDAVSIAEQMCECYKDYQSPSVSDCEKPVPGSIIESRFGDEDEKVDPRIIGGTTVASSREFPHMVALGYRNVDTNVIEWKCGGSLISSSHVLTAAHCMASGSSPVSLVRIGDVNMQDVNASESRQQFAVTDITVYDNYTGRMYYNDIAILKLNSSVLFSEFARPACLNTEPVPLLKSCVATGWGLSGWDRTEGSEDLMKANLRLEPPTVCNETFAALIRQGKKLKWGINDTMLCAGDPEKRMDTCQGDSGGPIQVESSKFPEMYNIIGVTSFGTTCSSTTSPAVYTRVYSYVPWIVSKVWPQRIVRDGSS